MNTTFTAWRKHTTPIALGVIACIAAYCAYIHHFIQDDAFIAFRYARHFAQGQGLVWQPGSDEYGYTNFLFALLVAFLMKLGFEADAAAFIISIPTYFISLALTFFISRATARSRLAPLVC